VYLHHRVHLTSSGEDVGGNHSDSSNSGGIITHSNTLTSTSREQLDVPRYTKLLLLAAFLASHIRASGDRQLFGSGSTTRRVRGHTREKRLTLVEPRAFPVERMLAIFFNLTADWGERVPNTAELYFQICSLVRINLLDRVSAPDRLSGVKLKANIDTQFATHLAAGINFPLHDYIV
jgi:origin recognition complex subunit 5